MLQSNVRDYIQNVLNNQPKGWLGLTTHRLDIYEEKFAKSQFLEHLNRLYEEQDYSESSLEHLPTAYDYIRLGHPLSCILEWGIASELSLPASQVISFSSQTIPVLSILRKNLLDHIPTRIYYTGNLPNFLSGDELKDVYGYQFELHHIDDPKSIPAFNGSNLYIHQNTTVKSYELSNTVDFLLSLYEGLGSVLCIGEGNSSTYVTDIQHVRRRETIAMTPANCHIALESWLDNESIKLQEINRDAHKKQVLASIKKVTLSPIEPLVGSSGLSIQYAIMMGLIDYSQEHYTNKPIKFIVPPNCYGGTNDQARRVAACLDHVEVVDLPVDGKNDMVQSINNVLDQMAQQDAVPFIIAEIPTNPRVEVPNLDALKSALIAKRNTPTGDNAIDPVFILDQTFCPNVHFIGDENILSQVRTISYASGSKFPSGGRCTAGYCVGNNQTAGIMNKIEKHLLGCDNEATSLQYKILAQQLPSMNGRIAAASKNTREFVHFIKEVLPAAKINFVSDELAMQGFTPSVFSLDLPTKGKNAAEKEAYKRSLNLKLIQLMIEQIPQESKFCVSYGQLKGCYWTIPATSTQGTTKEGDKDYIVRASLSPDLNLERHKEVFKQFVHSIS